MADNSFLYRYVNDRWYESFNTYHPSSEYLLTVASVLPTSWRVHQKGLWTYVRPPVESDVEQGWKIHVSSISDTARELLYAVANCLISQNVGFKFASDAFIHRFLNAKWVPRESGGKFVTIYPSTQGEFIELLDILYRKLDGFLGPYILSDRRYKDSKVLYYRFGSFKRHARLLPTGEHVLLVRAANGSLIPEKRVPYWDPPEWVKDPFEPPSTDGAEPESVGLHEGRYRVIKALRHSFAGGVYLAHDNHTGQEVVLKEGRPFTDRTGTDDRMSRLRREYRLLELVEPLGVAPRPIELFEEWEHLFIAAEYVSGPVLGGWVAARSPLGMVYPADDVLEDYLESAKQIWINLARLVDTCHRHSVICGDLSVLNIVVSSDGSDLKMVDWDGSWQEGVDNPPGLFTPGQQLRAPTTTADDIYSLGMLMLNTLWPVHPLFEVSPENRPQICELLFEGARLPDTLRRIILDCIEDDPTSRPTAKEVLDRLTEWAERNRKIVLGPTCRGPLPSSNDLDRLVLSALECANRVADFKNPDRLYPGDATQFLTNGVGFAYGATGTAYVTHRVTGKLDNKVVHWILSKTDVDNMPPGLYQGLAGVSCLLGSLEYYDAAQKTLDNAISHPLAFEAPNISAGSSGIGMASLILFEQTKRQHFLDVALQIGEKLLDSAVVGHEGLHWSDESGKIRLGYGRGVAGVASYLLYLSLASGDRRFVQSGASALRYLSQHLSITSEGFTTLMRGPVGSFEQVQVPSWYDGSAGVVGVLLRYGLVLQDPMWLQLFNEMLPDIFRQFMPFPNFFVGTAGLGSALLDAYRWTGEKRYLEEAIRAASGVLPYAVSLPEGTAFPGQQMWRLSTDFATGSAGIVYFLDGLSKNLKGIPTDSILQPDGLLAAHLSLNSRTLVVE